MLNIEQSTDIEFCALDFKMVLPQFMKQKSGLF